MSLFSIPNALLVLSFGALSAAVPTEAGPRYLYTRDDTPAATQRIAGIAGGTLGAVAVIICIGICFFARRMRLKRESREDQKEVRRRSKELERTFSQRDTVLLFSDFSLEDWKKETHSSVLLHVSHHPSLDLKEFKDIQVDGPSRSSSSSSRGLSHSPPGRHDRRPSDKNRRENSLESIGEEVEREMDSMQITSANAKETKTEVEEVSRPTTPWPVYDLDGNQKEQKG